MLYLDIFIDRYTFLGHVFFNIEAVLSLGLPLRTGGAARHRSSQGLRLFSWPKDRGAAWRHMAREFLISASTKIREL